MIMRVCDLVAQKPNCNITEIHYQTGKTTVTLWGKQARAVLYAHPYMSQSQ